MSIFSSITGDGLLGFGAGLVGTVASAKGQEATNAANVALAREQMDFQRRMSNTAYQRAMRDMRRAGLNPILAYQQGGASAPFGAAIPQVNPWAGAGAGLGSAVSSAVSLSKLPAELELLQEQADKVYQDRRTSRSVEALNQVTAGLRNADIDFREASTSQVYAAIRKMGFDTEKVQAEIRNLEPVYQSLRAQATSDEVWEYMIQNNSWIREMEVLRRAFGDPVTGAAFRAGTKLIPSKVQHLRGVVK